MNFYLMEDVFSVEELLLYSPPHLTQTFYDESLKITLFTATTGRGFRALVITFNSHEYQFSEEAYSTIIAGRENGTNG